MKNNIYSIVFNLTKDVKYLYKDHIRGIYATLINNYDIPNNQETIDIMKEAILDTRGYSEIEYEFEDDDFYTFWNNLTPNMPL